MCVCVAARFHRAHRAKKTSVTWRFGTWNVRSMLDAEGSVETVRQGTDARKAEDRKVDLVVRELGRYGVKVAALQETKWFGRAVYRVGECCTGSRPTCPSTRPTCPSTRRVRPEGEGCSHSAVWTSYSRMESSRRAVESVELQTDVSVPTNWQEEEGSHSCALLLCPNPSSQQGYKG